MDLQHVSGWLNLPGNSPLNNPLPQFVVLPSNLPYEYAPVTNPTPKGLGDNPVVRTLQILLSNPYTAAMVIALLVFLIVAGLVYVSIRKPTKGVLRTPQIQIAIGIFNCVHS